MSVACVNSGGRDSRHSSRPNRNGELAPTAICAAVTACAAFHTSENRAGVTWRCSCTEVQAASGTIDPECQVSLSTPSMSSVKSSPLIIRICSLSSEYRSTAERLAVTRSSREIVGRIPIITTPASISTACRWAYPRPALSSSASWSNTRPPSRWGRTFTSRLNIPSSVWKSGLAIRSSTCAFTILGMPSAPARFNSISSPIMFLGRSNLFSARSRSSPSRHSWSFLRYRCRSDRSNPPATTFSPIEASLLECAWPGAPR